jgi:hypothetical protein
MEYKIYRKGGLFYIIDTTNNKEYSGLTKDVLVSRGTAAADDFYIKGVKDWNKDASIDISEIQDKKGNSYSVSQFVEFYETSSSQDVNIQDQHTGVIIASLSNEIASSTLATSPTAIDDLSFDVADATGFLTGHYLSIFNIDANRFYLATILGISTNTLTVDTPLDFAFPVGSFITAGEINLNVNGESTPVIYGLRNTEEAIGSAFDITTLIFTCLTDTAVDLSKFGDITGGLDNGLVLRKKDGEYANTFNVKSNGDISNIMDFDPQSATNPAQGQDGFIGTMTFAGQNKMGVTIRLEPGEDIQLIVQDDLTSLTSFSVIAEGHIVE